MLFVKMVGKYLRQLESYSFCRLSGILHEYSFLAIPATSQVTKIIFYGFIYHVRPVWIEVYCILNLLGS